MSDPPPTSPQHSQHTARQLERSRREMQSPDGRRTPVAPPLPDPRYPDLPAHLQAQLAALPPLPVPTVRQRGRGRRVDTQHHTAAPPLPNQHYDNLPANLAAQYAALPPFPVPHRRQSHHSHSTAVPPSVSFDH